MNDNNLNDERLGNEPDDATTLAALSALGALDADDAARFDVKRASSSRVQADAVSFAETADLLATGIEPPPSLRASLLSQIAALPQLPAENSDVSEGSDPPAVAAPAPAAAQPTPAGPNAAGPTPTTKASSAAQSARTSKAQQKAKSRWYSGPASALVAAVALVAVLIGANVITGALNNGNGLQEALRLAHIDAQPDAMRETIRLTNINDEKQVTATLVWSGALAESVLIVDGLATLPDEKTYELWYIGESGPISAGVFNTHRSGESWRVLDGAMSAGDAVGVTVEPAGGSEQPTTDPLIVIHTS
ncbi:hypothetical protein L1277_000206 [Okibacterium sp. HSC-33S16]|uniref:anti-sigma factor n=1 Tax=Okibacterium sp. HSC-33S16 TaxID=2910965 RepID=UPI00209F4A9D|nr:anti-sigma factor [Okibacterium sp. HSC-33S16]MCP2030142.1 hypothetical protein [Okibacterium sp. HSC-33S16]